MGGLMSTVKANDLTNVTGGIPTVKSQQLIPTAWINFNGTGTVAIRDSEGVSSISDNGSGDYTVNFATAMANANYTPLLSTWYGGGSVTALVAGSGFKRGVTPSTTALRVMTTTAVWSNSAVGSDISGVYVTVMGGQS
jgi:hypothetical protein